MDCHDHAVTNSVVRACTGPHAYVRHGADDVTVLRGADPEGAVALAAPTLVGEEHRVVDGTKERRAVEHIGSHALEAVHEHDG